MYNMNIQEPPIRASYHTHERTCKHDNVEDIVHTSSQWQKKNSDGSWSDYTASTYDKGIYRCAYTVWIEPYKDKAQFTEDVLNVEVDMDATLIQSYLAEFASDYPIGGRVTILVD